MCYGKSGMASPSALYTIITVICSARAASPCVQTIGWHVAELNKQNNLISTDGSSNKCSKLIQWPWINKGNYYQFSLNGLRNAPQTPTIKGIALVPKHEGMISSLQLHGLIGSTWRRLQRSLYLIVYNQRPVQLASAILIALAILEAVTALLYNFEAGRREREREREMKNKAGGSDGEGGSGSAKRTKGSETPVEVLPKEIVLQMVKDRLARLSDEMGVKEEVVVEDDVVLALTESTCAFINHLSASGKKLVDADHILDALKAINLPQFVPDLEAALREENAGEKSEEKATADEGQNQDEQSSKDGRDAGGESSEEGTVASEE
ncbi:hypothetical protein B296_00028665 [Ensete ventricosum]|uniref:Transcription factor CBF/NF-Y/archaeal histone domain-containing protein n=1 Tax=Ensete ventricosum TaxID=4639 RepID=A0A427AET7_ENSVE|nr:hypothetical protein B296_00028665 [Ensete ventricosum]